ncbi:MAG: response regulator, partial [Acidobacteriota bacterium]
ESARIIHGGGTDLLNLINEVLDLSKIEAGRMDLHFGTVRVSDLADGVRASFQHMAEEKGLGLDVVVSKDAAGEIVSDRKRIEQVLRNLVSNAVKFTEKGTVAVTFGHPAAGTDLSRSGLSAGECLAIAVKDTGIGIAPGQQKIVFEAFQQADSGTVRKYGGTGLGLSISRELAHLLGGEIQLESEPGQGSTFTLYLPVTVSAGRKVSAGDGVTVSMHDVTGQRAVAVQIEDDRNSLEKDARVILVIEDDPNFARLLYEKCHEKGFSCLAAPTGEAGLEIAAKHLPNAVILDIRLPGMDGWAVLAALKEDTRTRHIPVHIVSVEEISTEALRKGAVGHATKPLDQEDLEETFRRLEQVFAGKPKRVLVVEDDGKTRRKTVQLIGNGDVKVDEAENGEQALQAIRSGRYDCVVLDLGLPDLSGGELLARLEREGVDLPPVIIHTARDLTREEEMDLREHAESIVIKDVRSQERLLDEVSLFLHRVVSTMPEKKKQMILNLHETDVLLKDKKVLIVDDDMRTTFALSRLLTGRGMKTLKAENGERALRLLDQEPNVDLVLMDIMMPVMDGYEAVERIRAQDRFRNLPIIVLTANAMPEDRAKCITAGANDYLPKPVDEGRMISMMRVWLYK